MTTVGYNELDQCVGCPLVRDFLDQRLALGLGLGLGDELVGRTPRAVVEVAPARYQVDFGDLWVQDVDVEGRSVVLAHDHLRGGSAQYRLDRPARTVEVLHTLWGDPFPLRGLELGPTRAPEDVAQPFRVVRGQRVPVDGLENDPDYRELQDLFDVLDGVVGVGGRATVAHVLGRYHQDPRGGPLLG